MMDEDHWKTADLINLKKVVQSDTARINGFLSLVDQLSS